MQTKLISTDSSSYTTFMAQAITCERGYKTLFTDVTFNLSSGEALQIVGKNGIGKTSLLRILAGLSAPYAGRILWDKRDIYQVEGSAIYAAQRIYIGHIAGIKAGLTVIENLQMTLLHYAKKQHTSIESALKQIGLKGYEQTYCYQLSAGQKKRVALARLILCEASLWLLDEPLAAMDDEGVNLLQHLLTRHCEQGGMVIFTTHQVLDKVSLAIKQLSLTQATII